MKLAAGGYAEYCAVRAIQCLPIPKGMDSTTAAAIPETYFTVWTNLFQRGLSSPANTSPCTDVSAASGRPRQLAKALGSVVHATAGSEEKCTRNNSRCSMRRVYLGEERERACGRSERAQVNYSR
jgi:NADPH:quinone reductase-like Zn-dependent oxidoreductase